MVPKIAMWITVCTIGNLLEEFEFSTYRDLWHQGSGGGASGRAVDFSPVRILGQN